MRTLDLHRDVGAYALGVLDAADAFRFEDHLMECPQCTLSLGDFGGVKKQLDLYARQTPAGVAPVVVAGPEMLSRLLGRTAEGRRRSRRRRLALVAVAAALVLGGPLTVLGVARTTAVPAPPAGTTQQWSASDGTTGMAATVTMTETDWGANIRLEMVRPAVDGVCSLLAMGVDGSEETVTTWACHARDDGPMATRGGASMFPDRIHHFEVRANGQVLARIGGS
ncbi:zf-HC2 domain-containing protein [Streptomyces sp. NPDC093085]|uniref:zf-HC2 domain-containing protein n=1 Tax=Streptomyces sp. NPDC093085 TaxID=3155068 RepID=UPI0034392EA6